MKIPIPLYRLEAILRHYSTVADAYRNSTRSTKAADALRLSRKELEWLRREIHKHKINHKCTDRLHSVTAKSATAAIAARPTPVADISATSPSKKSPRM